MRRILIALLALGVSAPALATVETATVPVLKRPVAVGEVIDARDISMVDMRLDRIGRTVVLSRESLVGLAARRMLNPGQPIQAGDVQRPVLVPKGGAVMMLVEAPGMFLSATGKALDNGGEGDLIQVMNVQTNRMVQALVTGPNQVKVLAGVRMARPGR
jgi:flagella basal body P-ring formation protein FlgA